MDYTTNFGMKLPKRGVDMVKVDDLNGNTEDIDTLIHQNRTMIGPAFDTTKAYVTGDPVVYLGELYVFTADKAAGAWDASKVTQATASEMGGSEIDYLTVQNGMVCAVYEV